MKFNFFKSRLTDYSWQCWFIISAMLFFAFFFTATLSNDALVQFPSLIYLVVGATLNLGACVVVGCYPSDYK